MTVHIKTRVLPGNRIEISAAGLSEGQDVDVAITPVDDKKSPLAAGSILDFLDSLPPGPRSARTWEDLEQQLREERDSWDR